MCDAGPHKFGNLTPACLICPVPDGMIYSMREQVQVPDVRLTSKPVSQCRCVVSLCTDHATQPQGLTSLLVSSPDPRIPEPVPVARGWHGPGCCSVNSKFLTFARILFSHASLHPTSQSILFAQNILSRCSVIISFFQFQSFLHTSIDLINPAHSRASRSPLRGKKPTSTLHNTLRVH